MRSNIFIMVTLLFLLNGCGGEISNLTDGEIKDAEDVDDFLAPDLALAVDGSSQNDAATPVDASLPCVDHCPASLGGVIAGCEKRFVYGVNYAWKDFSADFGGNAAWNQAGVSGKRAEIVADFTDMRAHGVDVIRWWLFPEFSGDGVSFDAQDNPIGLGGTMLADLAAALEIAAQVDVHLQLCFFSFDNFHPTRDEYGIHIPGITPIVTGASKRMKLLEYVVRPVARAVALSPHYGRVVSWDVINEPEWAMTGNDPYSTGNPAFGAQTNLNPVTFTQMELFVAEVIAVLHDESTAPVTVGGAAIKWPLAWSRVDLDYYSFHLYDWVNQWFPYNQTPAYYGVAGKPAVIGELPLVGLAAQSGRPAVSYVNVVGDLFLLGYAGATPWSFSDGPWGTTKDDVNTFAVAHPCVTRY